MSKTKVKCGKGRLAARCTENWINIKSTVHGFVVYGLGVSGAQGQTLPSVTLSGTNVCDDTPWKLVFYDDFSGSTLDTNLWYPFNSNNRGTTDDWCEGRVGYPGNHTIHRDTNVVVGGGTAKLKIKQQTNTWQCASCDTSACSDGYGDTPVTKNYTSGYISTHAIFNSGKVEAKMKMPVFEYAWATCWWWHTTRINEIDFAEVFGPNDDRDKPINTYNFHAWKPDDSSTLPDPMSLGYNFPRQNWWYYLWGSHHRPNEWHTYTCAWDTAKIEMYLNDVHVNTIWKYYKNTSLSYWTGLSWITLPGRVGSGCLPESGVWKITDGFPYHNQSESKLIFSTGITKFEKTLGTDGELGALEIDYVKVWQRHPEQDGNSPICADSTYPIVGDITGPDMLCEEASYTISPWASDGTWRYDATYLNHSDRNAWSATIEKRTPFPYSATSIVYEYGNGVPGCPTRFKSKYVHCPLSIATRTGAVVAYDLSQNARIHLLADVYDYRAGDSATAVYWKVWYNKDIDSLDIQTATEYESKGTCSLSPILNLTPNDKYHISWELAIVHGTDSIIKTGRRNSSSAQGRQQSDTNLYFYEALLPSLPTFDTGIYKLVSQLYFSKEEAANTQYVQERIDRLKTEALAPYIQEVNAPGAMYMEAGTAPNEAATKSKIYPNPTSEILCIEPGMHFDAKGLQYVLLGADGRAIMEGTTEQCIDVSSVKPGTYLLGLRQATHTEYHKIVISK